VLLDDRVTIATPEGVSLELVLAGVGSRFIARLLDTLIQFAIIFALALGIYVTSAPGVVRAVVRVLFFLVLFGYDIPFEVLNGGRTIGKLAAGIRVVGAVGEPVGFLASAIRTILRIVDFLPVAYVAGVICMVATKRDQRLGDLAAGTIVVRDRFPGLNGATSAPPTVAPEAVATWDVSALDPTDLATIHQFLDRRLTMPMPVRAHFAMELAARVGPRVVGAPPGTHPEYLLEGVVVAKQARG
jgi:uncharacterized RDD family membrane protein YckC